MILFPNAKINLGLRVVRKRSDGYHDLETVFYPVPLCDILEIIITENNACGQTSIGQKSSILQNKKEINLEGGGTIYYSTSGLAIDVNPLKDLVVKACLTFDQHFGISKNLCIHLHKIIPMGAGLGGGSSDAAFTLLALNNIFGEPATDSQVHNLALELGSDCPFFLMNQPVHAKGRGELFSSSKVDLSGWTLLILKPKIDVSTASSFSQIQPGLSNAQQVQIELLPVDQWAGQVINDFESVVFQKYPEIELLKEKLIGSGAVYASMSGSGSAVFGLFRTPVIDVSKFGKVFSFQTIL